MTTPKQQLDSFLERYTPEIAALGRAAVARLRKKFPRAAIMIYDNYNALVIGFGPNNEKPSAAAFSIALYPRWVTLFFLHGVDLPDPEKRLVGKGNQVRSVILKELKVLDEPAIVALLDLAAATAGIATGNGPKGPMTVRMISARQRPRTPARSK